MSAGKTLTIITGATRGLGRAMAQQLLSVPGASVLQISRSASDALEQTAEEHGAHLLQWQEDLSNPQPVAQKLSAWLKEHTAADKAWSEIRLINNAASLPGEIAPLADTDLQDTANALRVNLEAPLVLTAAFLLATRDASERGVACKVLNISSALAKMAAASMSGYCAAKAGLDHATRCIAQEEALRPHGALVCALHPGVVDTGMQTQMRETPAEQFPGAGNFQTLHSSGRLRTPQDAATQILGILNGPLFGKQTVVELPI